MAAHPLPAGPARFWRVSPLEVGEPAGLLAGSQALLDALADDPTPRLRWYRSTRVAVVLGRGQRKLELQPDPTLAVVHRASGGGAVLLTPELLSLDVAVPVCHPWLDGSDLGAVFATVGSRWASALAGLGVPAPTVHGGPSTTPKATDARSALLAAVCFASVGRGEVSVGDRKLVGLSQRRRRQGALVQCGLLRRWRPGRLLTALGAQPDDPELLKAAVGLDEVLEDPPDEATLIDAVTLALTTDPVPDGADAPAEGSPRSSHR